MLIKKRLVKRGILLKFKEDLGCSILIKKMDISVVPTTVVAEVLLNVDSDLNYFLEEESPYKNKA